MTRSIFRILRLPVAGAVAVISFIRSFGLVLPLYLAGIGFIVAGVWQASEPWGKAVLGIAILFTTVIVARMRR